jgi:hypothetical protein
MVVVDVSGCGGSNEQWKLPSVGGAAAQIALNATACLAVDGGAGTEDSIVLSSCGAAATLFAVKQNGSIIGASLSAALCFRAFGSKSFELSCVGYELDRPWRTVYGCTAASAHGGV